MPTSCEIEFENNPMKVIYAGQLLRGTVQLSLTEEKTVRGVYIRIHGKAYTHWTTGSGDNRKTYTGSEDYLDERTYFVGGSSGNVLHIDPCMWWDAICFIVAAAVVVATFFFSCIFERWKNFCID